MVMSSNILVLLPYASNIGFAIGRLIHTFFKACLEVTNNSSNVHFCFSDITQAPCTFLPPDFKNIVGFDVYGGNKKAIDDLGNYVQRHNIDLVFALDLSVQAPTLPLLRRSGVSRVISYWGAPMSSRNHGIRLFLKKMEVHRFRPNRPDLFIFESKAMQEFAILGRGIPPHQTMVIHTGVEPSQFRPLPEHAEKVYQEFEIPRDRKIVVFMGHMHKRKGVHILLQAANLLVTKELRSDIHFLFLGNSAQEVEELKGFHGEAVECGFVTFGGYRTDVQTLLAGCYVGCIPSTGWDSFPMSSLEMQACGVPVVVSQLQGVPETIEEGITGISTPTGDASALASTLAAICDTPELRSQMAVDARERIVKQLTLEHQIIQLGNAIKSQLKSISS